MGVENQNSIACIDNSIPLLAKEQAYPVEALGTVLSETALAIHKKIKAPLALCGHSLLATVNMSVQGLSNIVTLDNKIHPLSCFFIGIAASGERKSSVFDEFLKPLRDKERELTVEYKVKERKYNDKKEIFEKARQCILNDRRIKTENKYTEIKKLVEPIAPLIPNLLIAEPTYEGLFYNLKNGYSMQGLFSSEGGRFLSGHAMNSDNKIKTATGICEIWDGTEISRCRKGDGTESISGKRLSINLMVQNDIGMSLLNDISIMDQGLLSRCLVCVPHQWLEHGLLMNLKIFQFMMQ